jgi:hypothetical protein
VPDFFNGTWDSWLLMKVFQPSYYVQLEIVGAFIVPVGWFGMLATNR